MTYTCLCGHTVPSRESYSVSGSIPVPDECPECHRDLTGHGALAEEASERRRRASRFERFLEAARAGR